MCETTFWSWPKAIIQFPLRTRQKEINTRKHHWDYLLNELLPMSLNVCEKSSADNENVIRIGME